MNTTDVHRQAQEAVADLKAREAEVRQLSEAFVSAYESGGEATGAAALLKLLIAFKKPLQLRGVFCALREDMRDRAESEEDLVDAERMYQHAVSTLIPMIEQEKVTKRRETRRGLFSTLFSSFRVQKWCQEESFCYH
jgi:hypothetical protein